MGDLSEGDKEEEEARSIEIVSSGILVSIVAFMRGTAELLD